MRILGFFRQAEDWLGEVVTIYIAEQLRPWAERLAALQDSADLQHYNDRFSSFNRLSELLASIDGRGNDVVIGKRVDEMEKKLHFGKDEVVPVLKTVIPEKYKDLLNPKLPDHFGGDS